MRASRGARRGAGFRQESARPTLNKKKEKRPLNANSHGRLRLKKGEISRMAMVSINRVVSKQLLNARTLKAPVIVIDSLTFRIPPAGRGEREHKVQLDDQERPSACSCTCEEGLKGEACWAMARVLDVLKVFAENNVYVSRGATSSWQALLTAASAVERPATARVAEGGRMDLIWGEQPQPGMLYNVAG
jgi:hypothetical protein